MGRTLNFMKNKISYRIPNLYHDRRMESDDPVRQAQLIELHLLEVFKTICESHGFKYWIHSGTLIGALRHGGAIPWDDDLDVYLLKKDYRRFLQACHDELPQDVYLEEPQEDRAHREENMLTRFRDNYSTALAPHRKRLLINDHHGVCIDIFILEECGRPTALKRWVLHTYASNLGYFRRAHYDQVTVWNLIRKWTIGLWVVIVGTFWKVLQLMTLRKDYLSQTNFYTGWKKWMPKDWFLREGQAPRTVRYENIEVPIPFEAEKCLEMEYGDWKKLPSKDKRHGYFHIILPTTPCFHPAAMQYPKEGE